MARFIEKVEKLTLPVIPLRGMVAFPSVPINFELERDMSKKACDAALAADMYVFLVAQKDLRCETPERKDLYTVGCVAKIKQTLKKPDGNIRVVAEGMCRGHISEMFSDDGCLYADIISKTMTGESSVTDIKAEALIRELQNTMEDMIQYLPPVSDEFLLAVRSITNPGLLADFLASSLFVRYDDKQQVLEMTDPTKRVEKAVVIMENEISLLETEMEIHKKVKEQIDENQRDYYLREQLKVIQNELEEGDEDDYYGKIKKARLPQEIEEKLLKELGRLQKSSFGSPEASVLRNYLDICLDIPWNKRTNDRVDIDAARKILDADHDGLKKVKERLLEYLAVKQLNPELRHQILCLVGPPGVGKTSLASSIARAMKRKYVRVSLGGVRGESDIRGHRKT